MNILFYLAFGYITLYGCITFFLDKAKIPRIAKILMVIAAIGALYILAKYQFIEKQEQKYSDYMASMERRDISKKLEEMKEKDSKGLLTDVDYDRYIALYLENINLTLKQLDHNNLREWIGIYFDNVDKIPIYYTYEEWKESEKFVYSSILNEIIGSFANRNIRGGRRDKVIQDFKDARNRLLTAKDREFKK